MSSAKPAALATTSLIAALAVAMPILAQDAPPAVDKQPASVPATPAPAAPDTLQINLPANADLTLLVDLVSKKLGMNILYDDQIANKKITLKAPDAIPAASLRSLLETALAMKGLALVQLDRKTETGKPWYRIVPAAQLPQAARDGEGAAVVARIFTLKTAEPEAVANLIRPLLTQGGGLATPIPKQPTLLVTDYADRVEQVAKIITLADAADTQRTEFYAVKFVPPQRLADEAGRLLAPQGGNQAAGALRLLPLEGRGTLALSGRPEQVAQALALFAKLDVDPGLVTKVYTFQHASPENIQRVFKDLLPESERAGFVATVDGNSLIVKATGAQFAAFEALKDKLDAPSATGSSRMQFYKLTNLDAEDAKKTIEAIGGGGAVNVFKATRGPADQAGALQPAGTTPGAAASPATPATAAAPMTSGFSGAAKALGATVVADKGTNTLIVIGDPDTQALYKQLIGYLDVRRPQVLLECTIVTIDFSTDRTLAVDLGREGSGPNGAKSLVFTQFGVSTVDPATARLVPTVDTGGTAALLSAKMLDAVVRALKTDSRARVSSCPRILVNDNATGTLKSTNTVPYLSTNSNSTVATTSVGGSEEAGTSIKMTPHIAQGDHLRLNFEVELSSFTADGTDKLPPPSQKNVINSDVTIPDGDTIIVGGVTRGDESHTQSRVPWIGDIPILGYLFGSTEDKKSSAVLFVFMRPVIMRDDQFRDLKYYSLSASRDAKLEASLPRSEMQVLHARP